MEEEIFFCQNETYILKVQNDTNMSLAIWMIEKKIPA